MLDNLKRNGTWVMCKDPNGINVKPVYLEPRVIASPFELMKKPVVILPVKEDKVKKP